MNSTEVLLGSAMNHNLSDICEILMGQSPAGNSCNQNGHGIPLLNGPTEFGPSHPTPVQFTSEPKKMSQKGDLLFCVRGSTTGRMNWSDQEYAIGRGLAAIRGVNGYPNTYVKAVIENGLTELLLAASGSTFPNVSKELISRICFPSITAQKAKDIAFVLQILDDRFILLRETSTTLEAIAQTIFKSWFIDFDPVKAKMAGGQPVGMDAETAALFPDSMEESELGLIPKGWAVEDFGSVNHLLMGQSPPGDTYNTEGEGTPFYQGRTDFGARFPGHRVHCIAGSRIANAGEVLISVRAPVGDINQAIEKCVIGRGVASALHKSGSQTYSYCLLTSLKPKLAYYNGEGTVFGAINKSDFGSLKVVEPNSEVLISFDAINHPINEQIRNLFRETENLIALRDSLLPRLISGELQIPDEMLAS